MESISEGDPLLDLPEAYELVVSSWHEIGMFQSGMNGIMPLTFGEIKAYSDSSFELSKPECTLVAMMSREFVREYNLASEDLNRQAPHEGEANMDMIRQNVAKAFKAMFYKHKEAAK